MDYKELQQSLKQHKEQLSMITEALKSAESSEMDSLLSLEKDLKQLVDLTQESLNAVNEKHNPGSSTNESKTDDKLDDEYALFMQEMAETGAYDENNKGQDNNDGDCEDSNIDDELTTLLGMKCAVLHTHKWGGQPSLHNAMVSSIVPHCEDHGFDDIRVRVLFTHPTHAEMLPCPFYLDGDCRFDDENCRYSHGEIVPLSDLKDAIEPNFESVKVGSRILIKLKPQNNEDTSLKKKSTEKYHLWHRAVVKYVNDDKKTCVVKLEQRLQTGEKRKSTNEEFSVPLEDVLPLNDDAPSSDSDDSISDTEYPDSKLNRSQDSDANKELLVEKSFTYQGPAMGEWERHTKGIASKLMLAMGYVPGTGLGASSDGRLQPVEARVLPVGKSLDHCMNISERAAGQDPLKVEQRLKRIQKKEEERNKRAYEREKEKERRNVFNFLNRTLSDKPEETKAVVDTTCNIRQSTNQSLNIEQFKIAEDTKKIERELSKLNNSLTRCQSGTEAHRTINLQMAEKNKELQALRNREKKIVNEQQHRKDKRKMTVF